MTFLLALLVLTPTGLRFLWRLVVLTFIVVVTKPTNALGWTLVVLFTFRTPIWAASYWAWWRVRDRWW
jgi:hypothetical protein